MPSFEILADIFTRLSVFDSSNTVKTRKKYQPVFQKKAPNNIIILRLMDILTKLAIISHPACRVQ